jgi:hypothetical protein
VLEITPRGFEVLDLAPGLSLDALQSRTDARLHMPGKSAPAAATRTPMKQEPPPPGWDPLSIIPKR